MCNIHLPGKSMMDVFVLQRYEKQVDALQTDLDMWKDIMASGLGDVWHDAAALCLLDVVFVRSASDSACLSIYADLVTGKGANGERHPVPAWQQIPADSRELS